MEQQEIKITINEIPYVSIGRFEDNNDAIYKYYPSENTNENWLTFYETQAPVIILCQIGTEFFNYTSGTGSVFKTLFETDLALFKKFHEHYFYPDSTSLKEDIFEDFIFGRFSEYGDAEFEEVRINQNGIECLYCYTYENEEFVIEDEKGCYTDQVFIRKDFATQFYLDLEQIKQSVTNFLMENHLDV